MSDENTGIRKFVIGGTYRHYIDADGMGFYVYFHVVNRTDKTVTIDGLYNGDSGRHKIRTTGSTEYFTITNCRNAPIYCASERVKSE